MVIGCGIVTLLILAWFLNDFITFINQFRLDKGIVRFNKGSMYMLGGGLFLLLFTLLGVFQGLLDKELTSKVEGYFTKLMVFSVCLMIAFPHAAHFFINKYADSHNYSICDNASSKVRLYSEIYYTKTEQDCYKAYKSA